MEFIGWRQRRKIKPLIAVAGDVVSLVHKTYKGEKILLREPITRTMVFGEVGIFDCEVDGRPGIGGVLIEQEKVSETVRGHDFIDGKRYCQVCGKSRDDVFKKGCGG